MPSTYSPRRCSAKWLDGDCPSHVLAIMDNGADSTYSGRFTIFCHAPNGGAEIDVLDMSPPGGYGNPGCAEWGTLPAGDVATWRYRHKDRYMRWSELPAEVQHTVRAAYPH